MRDFFETKQWDRRGEPRLHVLAIPDPGPWGTPSLPRYSVAEQAEIYQAQLAGQPGLLPVPAERLHLTLWGPGPYRDEVDPMRLERAIAELREMIVDPRFMRFCPEVQTGPALVGRSNIRLDVYPARELQSMRHWCGAVFSSRLGAPELGSSRKWRPHVTIAYGNENTAECDPHVVNDIDGERAYWEIPEVHVVWEYQDRERGYWWEPITAIKIGPTREDRQAEFLAEEL